MDSLILHTDSEMDLVDRIHVDENDGRIVLESEQDCTALVESNKAFLSEFDERTPFGGEMVRVASIPMNVFCELQRQGIDRDKVAFRRWLNNPDNRFFRTRPGTI